MHSAVALPGCAICSLTDGMAQHNGRSHQWMDGRHVEKIRRRQSVAMEKLKRFWFPTDDTTGANGMQFGASLQ